MADAAECRLTVSILDNGVGYGQEYAGTIFEPFKRLHGSELPGSGLGLTICKKIVEHHHGRIWAESKPGEGAAFYIKLPLA
jgi:two-component system, chemotaxis family, sensor kinase Cph1